jgi:hypothetical protein
MRCPRRVGASTSSPGCVAIAPVLHPPPEDGFRLTDGGEPATERVRIGRIEEHEPLLEGVVQNFDAARLAALQPERHGAETQRRHFEAVQPSVISMLFPCAPTGDA